MRSPLALNISLSKTTSLVRCICCLHNWLIDQKDTANLPSTAKDRFCSLLRGGDVNSDMISDEENERGEGLNRSLDGGEHYDDVAYHQRRNLERMFNRNQNVPHPREKLMYKLAILGIVSRPQAMGTSTTNN